MPAQLPHQHPMLRRDRFMAVCVQHQRLTAVRLRRRRSLAVLRLSTQLPFRAMHQ